MSKKFTFSFFVLLSLLEYNDSCFSDLYAGFSYDGTNRVRRFNIPATFLQMPKSMIEKNKHVSQSWKANGNNNLKHTASSELERKEMISPSTEKSNLRSNNNVVILKPFLRKDNVNHLVESTSDIDPEIKLKSRKQFTSIVYKMEKRVFLDMDRIDLKIPKPLLWNFSASHPKSSVMISNSYEVSHKVEKLDNHEVDELKIKSTHTNFDVKQNKSTIYAPNLPVGSDDRDDFNKIKVDAQNKKSDTEKLLNQVDSELKKPNANY